MEKEAAKISFHQQLKELMDEYVNKIYDITKSFPKDELFGITSQLKRASLSVVLNYIEGYARKRKAVLKNFLEISYGSLKESKYLIYFSYKRGFIEKVAYSKLSNLSDRIGGMLWGTLSRLE
jgi:four helix bundle protein